MAESQERFLDRVRRDMAEQMGQDVDAERLGTVQFELDVLRQQGIAVFVHCHGTGCLRVRSQFSEIGVDGKRTTVYDAGWKYLAHKQYSERLASLTSRYRYYWEKHSVSLSEFGSKYRWMTPTKWAEWREQAAEIEQEVADIAQELADQYDAILAWQRQEFGETAVEAWQAFKDRNPEYDIPLVAFREKLIREAHAALPTREDLLDKIYFTFSTAIITTGADVLEDVTRKERLEHLRTRERELTRTLELEQDVARQMLVEQERTAIRKERAMQEAILEHAREELDRMGSPFQTVLNQVESQLNETMLKMADAINKHGFPRRQTLEALQNAVQQYRALSFSQDTRLDAELRELEAAISVPANAKRGEPTRDTDRLTKAILTIADATKAAAIKVAQDVSGSKGGRIDL